MSIWDSYLYVIQWKAWGPLLLPQPTAFYLCHKERETTPYELPKNAERHPVHGAR